MASKRMGRKGRRTGRCTVAGRPLLEAEVGGEALEVGLGEEVVGAEFAELADGAVLADVVYDGAGLLVAEVGVAHELLEAGAVDVQGRGPDGVEAEPAGDARGKVFDFVELVEADEAAEALAVADNLGGTVAAYAGNAPERSGVGSVEGDLGAFGILFGPGPGGFGARFAGGVAG